MSAILSLRQVSLLFMGSATLALGVLTVGDSLDTPWRWALMFGFFGGHTVLAVGAAKHRLVVAFPITRQWVDVFAVFGACWLGPIVWLHVWKKAQSGRMVQVVSDWPVISRVRLIWLIILILILCVTLFWFRLRTLSTG